MSEETKIEKPAVFEPKIMAFVCNWCTYAGADLAGTSRMEYKDNVRIIKLPCTGLRFFTVYGPWGRPDMALFKFTKGILEGTPIPVFNEAAVLPSLRERLDSVMRGLEVISEWIFVDDGSTDGTGKAVASLSEEARVIKSETSE